MQRVKGAKGQMTAVDWLPLWFGRAPCGRGRDLVRVAYLVKLQPAQYVRNAGAVLTRFARLVLGALNKAHNEPVRAERATQTNA